MRIEPLITHSGKYSWRVASSVNVRGAMGSPVKNTVVTPAALSRPIIAAPCSCSRAGSIVYGICSASCTPLAASVSLNRPASLADSAPDSA